MSDGRAIVFAGPRQIELAEVAIPDPGPEEVLIETEVTAVSQGTDRAMLGGGYAGVEERYPFVYGYSRVGRVAAVGESVTDIGLGDRVFAGMAGTRLDPADGLGDRGGGYTSSGVVHHTEAVRLPDQVGSKVAAIAALGAVAYQGVAASDIRPNARVLVVGLGAIGQFSALFAAVRGAQVWIADPVASRREMAIELAGASPLDLGAGDVESQIEDRAWGQRPWRGRNGVPRSRYEQQRWEQAAGPLDVIIDATGRPDAFDAYVPLLTREGCLCLQGYYATPLTLDFHAAHMKRLTVRCPGGLDTADYETVLRLLAGRELGGLAGLELPIADLPGALAELLFGGPTDAVAAVIRWSDGVIAP